MTIGVTISFNYEDQHWTHGFDVDPGTSVLKLKEKMLHPKGAKQDVDSFELRFRGQRVSDAEEIRQAVTLDFEYLGVEEGTKRAKEDEHDQKRKDREKAEAANKAKQKAQEPVKQAPKPKPKPAAAVSSDPVQVVVKHAMQEMQSQVTVEVPGNATIADLRRAIMEMIGETKISEVKIVKKIGTSFASVPENDQIENTREFLSMGRKLDIPEGDLAISVIIDAELDFKNEITVQWGTTVDDLKLQLAALDPTGATKPDTFGLGVLKAGSSAKPLPGTTKLTHAHLELQLTEPYKAPAKPVIEKLEDVPGVPLWKVVGGAQQGGILVRDGQDTKSTQLPERLATGAMVEQIELHGERLHFKKITGGGPPNGWVSLTVSGKELLKTCPAHEAFTFDRAVAMQKGLLEQFQSAEFQDAMRELKNEFPDKRGKYMMRRNNLMLKHQQKIIPKYGFDGSPQGVQVMMAAYAPHMGSPITQGINNEITKILAD